MFSRLVPRKGSERVEVSTHVARESDIEFELPEVVKLRVEVGKDLEGLVDLEVGAGLVSMI